MSSFLNANLDSEDEEDDDYAPTAKEDREAQKEDGTALLKPKKKSKRGRGAPTAHAEPEEEGDEEAADGQEAGEGEEEEEEPEKPRLVLPKPGQAAAKRAKIEAVWQALNSRDTGGANAGLPPSSTTNLAALCGRSRTTPGPSPELAWQKQLGLMSPQLQLNVFGKAPGHANGTGGPHGANRVNGTNGAVEANADASVVPPASSAAAAATVSKSEADNKSGTAEAEGGAGPGPSSQRQVSEGARAAAAAALAAAKEAASLGVSRSYNKVSVTETRRFAGQDIQVTVQKDKSKAAAEEAAKPVAAPSGLDRFLADLEKKKKVNILDKSKMDWNSLKSKDAQMEEELEAHKRSNKKYLDKVEFLKKAELREYELERDKRLAGDVRLRNRL